YNILDAPSTGATKPFAASVDFKDRFSEVCKLLRGAHHILVVSHHRPDGDALGSTIAAALWLQHEGHAITAWNEDGMPLKFTHLPESSLVTKPSEQVQEFDAVLALDTATKSRLGRNLSSVVKAPLWINIDHHVSNEFFGDFNLIDAAAPATGQILTEGFLAEKIEITSAMATNLYAAISTDTGSFQYDNTTARTLELASILVRAGVSVGKLSKALYDNKPRRTFELLRHALAHTCFSSNDRVASFALTMADATSLGIKPEDTEGIIDHLRSIEGVVAAVFFEELLEGRVRLSLRSKESFFDASSFCQQYGGGGHRMAAGASLQGSLSEVEACVLASIDAALPEQTEGRK
ncbi:MAG TPA: bifunctional oligoribonuclease/PAP phosphatase NrnA, partial [Chthoniobacterales bacterium]|nr:bifunctional oligoribonuclease/PAP phosphatase NrnA [Chthoniobacterales bacterium]